MSPSHIGHVVLLTAAAMTKMLQLTKCGCQEVNYSFDQYTFEAVNQLWYSVSGDRLSDRESIS